MIKGNKVKNSRKKKTLGIILGFEALIVAGLFLMVVIKGDISFHTIDAMESITGNENLQTDSGNEGKEGTGQSGAVDADPRENTGEDAGRADSSEKPETIPEDVYDTITISAAGDVTLGRDHSYGYEKSFDHELEIRDMDYGYFLRNVKSIFEEDDITIVNLETTLTTAETKANKKFRFKADPSYVEILKQGDIEAVSIANNHTRDYLEQGYQDTLKNLEKAEIGYFGYEHRYIQEVRGIRVGLAGFTVWEAAEKQKEEIRQAIEALKAEGADIVILMFHWGIERDYYPNSVQTKLAHYSIDQGADLVLGGHPHVLQGIEEYNGKSIIYSLGNFSFGGNKNPSDKDSMVYVHRFNFRNGELISQENEAIPCSISSVKERNNYQPTPLEGSEKERVLDKIAKLSRF